MEYQFLFVVYTEFQLAFKLIFYKYINLYLKLQLERYKFEGSMRNFFCFIGLAGIILLIVGYYFMNNGNYCYFLGIALMLAGFIGINKT